MMPRNSFESFFDETEFANYRRWFMSHHGSLFHGLPHSAHLNRVDVRQKELALRFPSYWLIPSLVQTNSENIHFLKRSDARRDTNCRNNKDNFTTKKFYPFHRNDENCRFERERKDILSQSGESRYLLNWNKNYVYQRSNTSRDRRKYSKEKQEESQLFFNDVKNRKYERWGSLDSFNYKNDKVGPHRVTNVENKEEENSEEIKENQSEDEIRCAQQDVDSSSEFSQVSQQTSSTSLNAGYDSWFCAEEQQHIVDMLMEVHLRHERQLERNMKTASGEISFSDDSVSVEPQISPHASMTSEDDEDGIIVFVPRGKHPSENGVLDVENIEIDQNKCTENYFCKDFIEFPIPFASSAECLILKTPTKDSSKPTKDSSKKKREYFEPANKCDIFERSFDETKNQNAIYREGVEECLKNVQLHPVTPSAVWKSDNTFEVKEGLEFSQNLDNINKMEIFSENNNPLHKQDSENSKNGFKTRLKGVNIEINSFPNPFPQNKITESQEVLPKYDVPKKNCHIPENYSNNKNCGKKYFKNSEILQHGSFSTFDSPNRLKGGVKSTKIQSQNTNRDTELKDKSNLNENSYELRADKCMSRNECVESFPCSHSSNSVSLRKDSEELETFSRTQPFPVKDSEKVRNHDKSVNIIQCRLCSSTRPVESDTCLSYMNREIRTHPNPIPSLSDSCLTQKSRHVYYKRITVEELFRTFDQKVGEMKSYKPKEYPSKEAYQTVPSPTDHLKQILGITSPTKFEKTHPKQKKLTPVTEKALKNNYKNACSGEQSPQREMSQKGLLSNQEGNIKESSKFMSDSLLVLGQHEKNSSNSCSEPKIKYQENDLKVCSTIPGDKQNKNHKNSNKEYYSEIEENSLTKSKMSYSNTRKPKKFMGRRKSKYMCSNCEVTGNCEFDRNFMQNKSKRKNRFKRAEKTSTNESERNLKLSYENGICLHEKTHTSVSEIKHENKSRSMRIRSGEKSRQLMLLPNEIIPRKENYQKVKSDVVVKAASTSKDRNGNHVALENRPSKFYNNNLVLNVNVVQSVKNSKVKSGQMIDFESKDNASYIRGSRHLIRDTSLDKRNRTGDKPSYIRGVNNLHFQIPHKRNFEKSYVLKSYFNISPRGNSKKSFTVKYDMPRQKKVESSHFNSTEMTRKARNVVSKNEVSQEFKKDSNKSSSYTTKGTPISSNIRKYSKESCPTSEKKEKTNSSHSPKISKSVEIFDKNSKEKPHIKQQKNVNNDQNTSLKSYVKVKLPKSICKDILKNGHFPKSDFIYNCLFKKHEEPEVREISSEDKNLIIQTDKSGSGKRSESICKTRQSLLIIENGKFGNFNVKKK